MIASTLIRLGECLLTEIGKEASAATERSSRCLQGEREPKNRKAANSVSVLVLASHEVTEKLSQPRVFARSATCLVFHDDLKNQL